MVRTGIAVPVDALPVVLSADEGVPRGGGLLWAVRRQAQAVCLTRPPFRERLPERDHRPAATDEGASVRRGRGEEVHVDKEGGYN